MEYPNPVSLFRGERDAFAQKRECFGIIIAFLANTPFWILMGRNPSLQYLVKKTTQRSDQACSNPTIEWDVGRGRTKLDAQLERLWGKNGVVFWS